MWSPEAELLPTRVLRTRAEHVIAQFMCGCLVAQNGNLPFRPRPRTHDRYAQHARLSPQTPRAPAVESWSSGSFGQIDPRAPSSRGAHRSRAGRYGHLRSRSGPDAEARGSRRPLAEALPPPGKLASCQVSHTDRVPLAPEPLQRAHGCKLGRARGEAPLGPLEGDLHLVALLCLRATELGDLLLQLGGRLAQLLLLLASGLVQPRACAARAAARRRATRAGRSSPFRAVERLRSSPFRLTLSTRTAIDTSNERNTAATVSSVCARPPSPPAAFATL
jgi:hypothetical protein